MVTTDTSSLNDVVLALSLPESTELVECEGVFKIPGLEVVPPTGLLLTCLPDIVLTWHLGPPEDTPYFYSKKK